MDNITTNEIREIIKPRPLDMHKGRAGRLLLIAGSKGMAGAAVLATKGALYSGAGLVTTSIPEELFTILQISVPEAMCIGRENLSLEKYDAIGIGPGLRNTEESYELVKLTLSQAKCPVIIDADGINSLCTYGKVEDLMDKQVVLTPHPGEAKGLLQWIGKEGCSRQEVAEIIAENTGAIVLLKGLDSLVCDPQKNIVMNPTGNPGMATGGSGDVLTGIITGLMAQAQAGKRANREEGIEDYMDGEPLDVVKAATFIHGLAGDIAAENIGEMGMTAADIADAISMALREFS